MSKSPFGVGVGQGRAPNTLQLRNLYTNYAVEAQSQGQQPMDFETWAMQNFPEKPILNQ